MKKIILSFILMISVSFHTFSEEIYKSEEALALDGRTHYGLPIEDVRKLITYDDFAGEVIISAEHSDNLPGKYLMTFYEEFTRQLQRVLNEKDSIPEYKLQIRISNCRFGKTGYCGRENRTDIIIAAFKNGENHREMALERIEVIHPDKYMKTAEKAAVYLLKD